MRFAMESPVPAHYVARAAASLHALDYLLAVASQVERRRKVSDVVIPFVSNSFLMKLYEK